MVFSRRAFSSSREASSRSFMRRSQASSGTSSSGRSSSRSKDTWTDCSFVPGSASQISSEVKGRTGAARVAIARPIRDMAVWADRRSRDAAGEA